MSERIKKGFVLTDLWSSTALISVTGSWKKTLRGPSAETGREVKREFRREYQIFCVHLWMWIRHFWHWYWNVVLTYCGEERPSCMRVEGKKCLRSGERWGGRRRSLASLVWSWKSESNFNWKWKWVRIRRWVRKVGKSGKPGLTLKNKVKVFV